MTGNTFGKIFKVTIWRKSGSGLGVIDGVPADINLNEKYIQSFLDKRNQVNQNIQHKGKKMISRSSSEYRGNNRHAYFAPNQNKDVKSKDYDDIKDKFRPGHDYTYQMKYGFRDYRGGGRASARKQLKELPPVLLQEKFLETKLKLEVH